MFLGNIQKRLIKLEEQNPGWNYHLEVLTTGWYIVGAKVNESDRIIAEHHTLGQLRAWALQGMTYTDE